MTFRLDHAAALLERTPSVLRAWLDGLPAEWIHANEGGDTFSPFDVVGHLVHGERKDWIVRARQILDGRGNEPFEPFDRFAMREESKGKNLTDLLDEFARLRRENLRALTSFGLDDQHLTMEGLHPELGRVTLGQLLATWTAHDQNHIGQIARVIAHQYRDAVGPWRAYLGIMRERDG